ncbi:MAG: glycosyltransferase [Romboutsia sp.]
MKFSVLMSVYKNEKATYLEQSIKSVLNQTLKPSEIVIVKDGPLTKELDDVINKYKINNNELFNIIILDKNVGLGRALNKGILHCKYDIIARMDSDDVSMNERFEKQINILKENNNIDIVGSYIGEFSKEISLIEKVRKVPISNKDITIYSKRRNPLNHMSVMYRKKAVIDSGNYQDSPFSEDYNLWVRMFIKGYKALNIPENLVSVRCNDDMYRRRGGIQYIKSEYNLQKYFLKLNHINLYEFLTNLFIRIGIRIVPNNIRKTAYNLLLRSKI